jgi:hypothetical protein
MAGPNNPGNGRVVAGVPEFPGEHNPCNGDGGGSDDDERDFHTPPIRFIGGNLAKRQSRRLRAVPEPSLKTLGIVNFGFDSPQNRE